MVGQLSKNMKNYRENPESKENQKLTLETEKYIKSLKLAAQFDYEHWSKTGELKKLETTKSDEHSGIS